VFGSGYSSLAFLICFLCLSFFRHGACSCQFSFPFSAFRSFPFSPFSFLVRPTRVIGTLALFHPDLEQPVLIRSNLFVTLICAVKANCLPVTPSSHQILVFYVELCLGPFHNTVFIFSSVFPSNTCFFM
jgi:hypothetical protein